MGNSPAAAALASEPLTLPCPALWCSPGGVEGPELTPKVPGRVHTQTCGTHGAQPSLQACSPRDGAHMNLQDRVDACLAPVLEAKCSHPQHQEGAHLILRDWQLLILPHLQASDVAHLTPRPRGTTHPTPAPQGKQHRRQALASARAATAAGRAHWLSKRKEETPPA